jgi:hypothetical protein
MEQIGNSSHQAKWITAAQLEDMQHHAERNHPKMVRLYLSPALSGGGAAQKSWKKTSRSVAKRQKRKKERKFPQATFVTIFGGGFPSKLGRFMCVEFVEKKGFSWADLIYPSIIS